MLRRDPITGIFETVPDPDEAADDTKQFTEDTKPSIIKPEAIVKKPPPKR